MATGFFVGRCRRRGPVNAETLYKLVLEVGKSQTWIVVEEEWPHPDDADQGMKTYCVTG